MLDLHRLKFSCFKTNPHLSQEDKMILQGKLPLNQKAVLENISDWRRRFSITDIHPLHYFLLSLETFIDRRKPLSHVAILQKPKKTPNLK